VSVEGDVLNSSIESQNALTGSISIAGSLNSTSAISLPSSGLVGRIIVNEYNGAGSWTGDLIVGATTLASNYGNTAASLGGGSAGTVPFDLHGTDSTPLDGASVLYANRPGPSNPIRIRHYGPIAYESGQIPVTIKAESYYNNTEVDKTGCIIPTSANVVRDAANNTILVITPNVNLPCGFTYRVRPVLSGAAVLNCSIASPVPVPVADWEEDFCVGTVNPSDLNGNDLIDTGDFNILAGNWAVSGCLVEGDIDTNGIVNAFDFNLIASQWGQGPFGTCNSSSLMARSNDGGEELNQLEAVVVKMGFESLGDFSAWLDELPEKDQLDVLMELISQLGE